MLRRRRFGLAFVSVLASLYFLLSTNGADTRAAVDAALDRVLQEHSSAADAPDERFRRVQASLTSPTPKSPRDFRVQKDPIATVCSLLSSKRILLVGPQTTYYLHSLWLNALSPHDDKMHQCPGIDLCHFHHICLPPGYASSRARYKLPPQDDELAASNSSLLRYVLSTSLSIAPSKNDTRYTKPFIDPNTGVRLKNAYWLHYAQQSRVILINRGPIPAPASTYAGDTALGNWSFVEDIPRHLRLTDSLIVNAALHATKTTFIPEVLQSLREIQKGSAKVVVWHASWYHDFVAQPFKRIPEDPWAAYYNLQVYMENYLLEKLLPLHGIYFLPQVHSDLSDARPKDGLRYPLESADARAMEASFLQSLVALLGQA